MSKLVADDGRTHIQSNLMRESLVDRRVIRRTHTEGEFRILPDVVMIGIGGQSIFDRGKDAVLPLVEEIAARTPCCRSSKRSRRSAASTPCCSASAVGRGSATR